MECFIDNKHFLPLSLSLSLPLSFHMPLRLGDECPEIVIATTTALKPQSHLGNPTNSQTITSDSGCIKRVFVCLKGPKVLKLVVSSEKEAALWGNQLSGWRGVDVSRGSVIGRWSNEGGGVEERLRLDRFGKEMSN
ncbi:Hypothetical predicted protein [Xyrichtys novacula]|uniref:Uncharacterized protein n=1 Tax=Xyrichtys novacula TaxID=13765 RepID=A0AAV1GZB0_XYRNO|nr:Hypothetical predicted protein [Xyrichtys novacula]